MFPGLARAELATSKDTAQCVQHLRVARMLAGRAPGRRAVRQFLRHQVQLSPRVGHRCRIEL